MHIENFKIFIDLVEKKSFSKAAKLNKITQSAVSQQIKVLEKHYNITVIDRSHKNFSMTSEGEKLFESAREIINKYEKMSAEILALKDVVCGTIHISTIYSIGLHELPPYIKNFLRDYPTVNVKVEYRRSNLVYDDILGKSADLGIVAFPIKLKQLEILPFREDKLSLVCSPEHRLANKKEIDIKEIKDQKFISFDKDIPTRKAIDLIFKEKKISVETVMEFDNVETIKRAVEINAGVSIIPEITASQEVNLGVLKTVKIKGKKFKRPLAIIYLKGRHLTPAMHKFIGMLMGKPFVRPDKSLN